MIEILELSDDKTKAVPSAMVMNNMTFKEILDRDKSKGKNLAMSEFSYIFHTVDPRSPYAKYPEDIREKKIIEAFLPEGWKPDTLVWEATKVYREMRITPTGRLLESALKGVNKLEEFFKDVNLITDIDKNGRPLYKPTDITGPLMNMGKITQGLKDLIDQVNAEQEATGATRSNVTLNRFSE